MSNVKHKQVEVTKNKDGVVGARRLDPVQPLNATDGNIRRIAELCATYGVVVDYDPESGRFEVTYV